MYRIRLGCAAYARMNIPADQARRMMYIVENMRFKSQVITSRLRTKMLFSVGITIFVVLGTSTIIYIQGLKRNYLEAVEWRSERLAQIILKNLMWEEDTSVDDGIIIKNPTIKELSGMLIVHCIQLFTSNRREDVTHLAVIDDLGTILAHNEKPLWNTPVESPIVLAQLQHQKTTTVLDGRAYHTLVPIFNREHMYLGVVDVGFPKAVVDQKVQQLFPQAGVLFGLFLLLAFFSISLLMHHLITKPIGQLVTVGEKIAQGEFGNTEGQDTIEALFSKMPSRRDEIGTLTAVFRNMITYLQNIARASTLISNGDLRHTISPRSEFDVLGKAFHRMTVYLNEMTSVATVIADGDLTHTIQLHSADDTFGSVIRSMTEGLRSLIVQIRTSAEQIATIETGISLLTTDDLNIVQEVSVSVKEMIATVREIGTSVQEVADKMDVLSASVEETSASVAQMAPSIGHIASNTTELAKQTDKAKAFLDETVGSLEQVVESTETSKQLSQETIQDALNGQEAIAQVTGSMDTLQHTITTATEAMHSFSQRSQDIETILDVIRNIAEQTSLLALNASIIAAQAGEHGRGFAVVAEEIKTLANGVTTSTKDITVIIQTLQQETHNVVQTVHTGVEDVAQGMDRTRQAREALQKIISSAQKSSTVVTEISEALHELMANSHSVAAAMNQVKALTDEMHTATNEQEISTIQMNQAIAHINELSSQIQQSTTYQSAGLQQVLETTNDVTALIDQNFESSQQMTRATQNLASQAKLLMQSVDRFTLNS